VSKYVGVMAEAKRTICLCSIPNGRSLVSMVYLFASKLEGESGPRFLPVQGRVGRLWGPPYEQRRGGRFWQRWGLLPPAWRF
jgi:hypothetical protein